MAVRIDTPGHLDTHDCAGEAGGSQAVRQRMLEGTEGRFVPRAPGTDSAGSEDSSNPVG
jgi:hypothetical protein